MQTIALSDITMKSGARTLSFKEKIETAKLLDKLQVSAIELPPLENTRIDSLLVKSVASAVKRSTVALEIAPNNESLNAAWAALKDAHSPRLQLRAPMSPMQMEYFWHKKPEKTLTTIRDTIAACRALCPQVEFIADDACRSETTFLSQAIQTAIDAGATVVTLCDAAGLMLPEEFQQFLKDLLDKVPALQNVTLAVQCNDTLSLSNACAMAAIAAGAREIKVTACGAVGTSLSALAKLLQARGDSFQVGCDIRHAEIKRILERIEWLCNASRSQHSAFDHSGDHAEMEGTLSQHDDRTAVLCAVEKLGYALSEEDGAKVYEAFQRIAEKKEQVSLRELDSIVASVALQVPPTFKLDNFVINCGNVISASAHIKLVRDNKTLQGICLGDGPIDAAFLAIEQVVGRHFELDDFQIQSVTEGREAMGETVVRLRSNGKLYSGRGISTDIVGASIHAYISALNKIVYEEAEA